MKIERTKLTVEDTKDNLVEMVTGVKCGCKDPVFEMVSHIDGIDFYQTTYRCSCGNIITATCERSKENNLV